MPLAPITTEDHQIGTNTAPIILVEYGDYQCPTCTKAHGLIKRILDNFGDKICFIFRHFPMSEAHPTAEMAAQAAEFAGKHNLFWEMHDLLYTNQEPITLFRLLDLGKHLNLPLDSLSEAITQKKFSEIIRESFLGGIKSSVNGTPTFFINGKRYNGPIAALGPYIDSVLSEKEKNTQAN